MLEDQGPLDTEAAAKRTGLSASSLEKLRVTGMGPAYLKLGRRVVYDIRDLESWMAARRVRSTSEVRK